MAKYINPFTDAGFKRIFGQEEHKGLLIAFLNRLFEGQMVITDVQYMDKEAIAEDNSGKSFIYDVYCTLDTGQHVIVEMQNKQQQNFAQRSLLYATRALDRQARKQKDWTYKDLKAVISISFLNFKMEELPPQLLVDGTITDFYSKKQINSFLRLIYIQLPLMTKELEECNNDFERWIYLLKNIEQMEDIPAYLRKTLDELQQFEDVMNEASLTAEDRVRYERSLDYYRNEMDSIAFYREEGREEGREARSFEIARNMKGLGLDVHTIAKATGLTASQIENL